MINANSIIDALVTKWRAIPALVVLMGGNANNIYAYKAQFPTSESWTQAVTQMIPPSMMVRFRGTAPAEYGMGAHKYRFVIYIRHSDMAADVLKQMLDGVPTGFGGQKFLRTEIVPECDPIDHTSLRSEEKTLPVGEFGLDYFEVEFAVTEKLDSA